MKFNGITKKGREYLAKIQSLNKPINFSKIKIGDGLLDNYDNPSELIDLQNFKIEKGILELNQENETVILKTNIDNVNLQTGYYPREIGVFVNDDGQELMYYYMNDGDETSWIPPESDGPFRIDLKINLIATNTTSIVVPNSGKELYITKEFIENNYTKNGSFTGTAKDLEDRIIGLAGKQNGKFPLNSAIKGNVYLLEQTQKFYVCTQNYSGTTISVPNANFTELSVYENMNRLENLNKYLQYVVRYNSSITFEKNDIGASITSDALGIRLAKNHRVLVIASASTGNNSHGLGIFPNSEKSFSTSNCGFSFYPQANSRITCTYILENTDTIYVRALSMRAPYTHPQFITQYLDRPENDILVNCILLD